MQPSFRAAIPALLLATASLLSACAGSHLEIDGGQTGPVAAAPSEPQQPPAPGDASWPPAPVVDPDPIVIVVPMDWSEADKEKAREWVTVQQSTRQCQLQRGIDSYRYFPIWEQNYDDSGVLVSSGPAPSDWDAHFQRPFQWFRSSAVVCFNRALVQIGRPPNGPVEFAERAPRFEESDFYDAETLDIPADWSAEEQAAARQSWSIELLVRACMASAGYSGYGEPPYWLMPDAYRAQDPWISTFPLARQAEVTLTLDGDYGNFPYDWQKGGCTGEARHNVEGL